MRNTFLDAVPETHLQHLISMVLSFGPLTALLRVYQRRALRPLAVWELPAYAALFSLYCYIWLFVTVRAWARLLFRRGGWVKTPRVAVTSPTG